MIEVLAIALQMGTKLYEQSELARQGNQPDWAKYAAAGAYAGVEALKLFAQWKQEGEPDRYDTMTPVEIVALLTPPTWDELPVTLEG